MKVEKNDNLGDFEIWLGKSTKPTELRAFIKDLFLPLIFTSFTGAFISVL